ncbi:MAG: alpha/beta hydrolase family protein [Deltaproteobacteria bacterium]|nr:alpha/beta hydrolase family protein [Deltaproteobacteria bacterium]
MIRSALHRYTDLALTSLLRGVRLYEDGFGDRESLMRLVDAVGRVAREDPLPELELRWDEARTSGTTRERHGRFASPALDLPPESRDVHLLWLDPIQQEARPREVVVLLAATGEEGFFTRRRFAAPLVASGRAVLLVENPFYGARRPRGQRGPGLRTVRDQFAMNLATVLEGRAIAGWLASERHPKIVLSGYSQGGIMAAFVSALVPFATGCVPRGAGARVEAIFTKGALSRAMDWQRLARELGSRAEAAAYFESCLAPVRVDRHPAPLAAHACIVVGARHDAFVPPEETEALHRHWPGSELRWDEAGHVTAALLGQRGHQRAILDAFARLPITR